MRVRGQRFPAGLCFQQHAHDRGLLSVEYEGVLCGLRLPLGLVGGQPCHLHSLAVDSGVQGPGRPSGAM